MWQKKCATMPPDMNYAYRTLLKYWVEPVVLRESIRARVAAGPLSVLNTALTIILYVPFLLAYEIPYSRIVWWALPIFLLIVARASISRFISLRLERLSTLEMLRADRVLRISSIINQVTVGMGVWIVQSPDKQNLIIPLFMTMIVVSWSIGVIANLFSDFPSFIASMPIMLGINASYWIVYGGVGISIGLALLLTISLMILLVHRGSHIFRSSILMRFEKDQLLEQLAAEKEKTESALQEAQAANYAKSYFMAAAKHDIKQPLHALALLTDTLLMSNPLEAHVALLKQQRASIGQMADHFDALMDMRSFISGHFELNITRFRLGAFAARIDSEIAPTCAGKGLTWSLDMEDVLVSTDEELLLRLFRNLLTNAVRYTENGEVSCSARARGDVVEFFVTDTGMGIASEHQDLVFEDFVRLEFEHQEPTGNGLGLSIVKKINQALHLNLQMSSISGKGTQFSFWLPIVTGP